MRLVTKTILSFLILLTLNGISLSLHAGVEIREFSKAEEERRYHKLIDELRCLVCQNQNLADSNSQLAQDLRAKVYEMVTTNKTDREVTDYMVQRYGEYVLYNPPLDPVTSILWIGPLVGLLVAIMLLLFNIYKRGKAQPVKLSDEDRKRMEKLLDENEDKKDDDK